MLLDIAYYFRYIGDEYTKIYGIFTMYNDGLALGGDSKILLANCWASLVEQDFYQRPGTEYRLTLPDGAEISEHRAPFNVASFLSPTGMKGLALVDAEGKFVTGQLDHMVATDLFVRSLGVDSLIEADLVNAPARDPRFKKVRDVADADETAFVQSMFSSGVDIGGVWLPKAALVSSAAGVFIKMLREKWKNGEPPPGSPEADKFVPAEIVEGIKSAPQIEAFDAKLQADINAINQDNYRTEARACLEALVVRQGAKYYDESEGNRAAYSQKYRERLNKTVESFEGDSQLCRKQKFLQKVEELIHAELDKLADDFPEDFTQSEVDIGRIVDEAVKDNTTERNTNVVTGVVSKLLGMKRSEEDFKLAAFQSRIHDEQTKFRKRFMDWCDGTPRVRETLRNLLRDTEALRREVDKEIGDIDKRFETSVVFLSEDDPSDGIGRATEHLANLAYSLGFSEKEDRAARDEELIRLIRIAEPDAFRWHVQEKLRESFHKFIPALLESVRFDKEAGKRSSPYQEFTPFYDNYKLDFDEKGGSTRLFRYLLAEEEVAKSIGDLKSTQAQSKGILVPNLRVLYQMEAGYTPDDVRVAGLLKKAYDAAQRRFKRGEDDPIHIHKNPDMFGEEAIRRAIRESQEAREIDRRFEEVQKDAKALQELRNYAVEENGNCFQYVSSNGIGDLTIEVPGENGFLREFNVADESDMRDLATDSAASTEFKTRTRSEFGILDVAGTLVRCIDRFHSENVVNRKESEKFYMEYTALVRKQRASDQGET